MTPRKLCRGGIGVKGASGRRNRKTVRRDSDPCESRYTSIGQSLGQPACHISDARRRYAGVIVHRRCWRVTTALDQSPERRSLSSHADEHGRRLREMATTRLHHHFHYETQTVVQVAGFGINFLIFTKYVELQSTLLRCE
jgi:hypothetical protein